MIGNLENLRKRQAIVRRTLTDLYTDQRAQRLGLATDFDREETAAYVGIFRQQADDLRAAIAQYESEARPC